MSRNGEGLWGTLGAIGLAALMGWEFIRTYKKENELYEEYENQQTMKKEEENKKSESATEASAPVIVPNEVESHEDYMEWRRKNNPTWIDKAGEMSEDYMSSGGMLTTLAIAIGNDKAAGQLLNTVAKHTGERAVVREKGVQQRLTYSNKAAEDRATHTSETNDNIRKYDAEINADIRKKEAEERIRQDKERFDQITIIKERRAAGLYTPPSAAKGTPPPAADALAEPPRRVVYSDLGDIASNPENRVRPILGNWLKQREITFIVGGAKSSKTTLGVQMAIDLCDGEYSELFDCEVLKQRVVYLSYELKPEQWGERYYNAGNLLKKKGVNIILKEQLENLGAFSVEGTLRLCHDICDGEMEQGTKRLTIFIDNFTLVAKNPGNPTAKECKVLYEGLDKLIEECKRKAGLILTIIVVGHTSKDGKKLRGSSVMVDLVDSVILISPIGGENGESDDEEDDEEDGGREKVRYIAMKENRSSGDPKPIYGIVTTKPYLHLKPFRLGEYIKEEQVKEAVNKQYKEWKREAQEEWKREAEEAQVVPSLEVPATEQSAQPDSASDEPQGPSLHEWTALQWRDLDKAEQRALYHIITRESESGINNKGIAHKILERFGVTVQESKIGDFVNAHKKGEVPNLPEVTTERGKDDIKRILMDYYPDGETYWDSLFS